MIKFANGLMIREKSCYAVGGREYKNALREGIHILFDRENVKDYNLQALFHDNMTFWILTETQVGGPDPKDTAMIEVAVSEYKIAGEIVYNRDDTISVFMYKPTYAEVLEAENAALLLKSICGE